jgi:hypothetical protein
MAPPSQELEPPINPGRFSYTTLRKIKTDQKSTCSSTLEYKKKAGHLNFDIPEQNATFSDIHAENVTCSIAETAD